MDIDVGEPHAPGPRARRRALLRLGVSLVSAAVLIPLAVVSVLSRDDDVTGDRAPQPPGPAPTGPISPPGPPGTTRPVGYLVHGYYHPSSGGDPVRVDLPGTVSYVSEVGDDLYVFWGDYRLTRIDPSGTTHDEACTGGTPQTSPSGARVALARIPCSGATGPATIAVSGPSGDRTLPVVGTLPRLLGVDDDGTVVYVDLRAGDYRDVVHVIDPDGRDRVVRGVGYVHDYDPVHHVLLTTLRFEIGARAGGALTLDGDLLWSSDRTSALQASPDGRYVIVSRIPTRVMFYPPRSHRPLVSPRVVDLLTGRTVLDLPELAPDDGALITAYQFDDDDHVLAEAWRHHRHRFVRITRDGAVTDVHPDLSGPRREPGVLFQTR